MGSQCCAMFVDTIVDDRANIRVVEISIKCVIDNVPGRVGCYSEKF
jgi:hypothetical protein